MTLGFWPLLAWALELALEAFGAYFFFRRRTAVLWIWLGFRAAADLVSFLTLSFFGQQAYAWADYLQRNAQYVLLAAVAAWTVSQVLREHPKTQRAYLGLLCVVAAYAVVQLHALWPPSAQAVSHFEIGMEAILAGFVAAAMGVANGRAPKPWGMIAYGLIVLAGSDLLVTILRVQAWYPAGAIVALSILCWAGWKNYELEEVRVSLGMKKPPTSVALEHRASRLVQ